MNQYTGIEQSKKDKTRQTLYVIKYSTQYVNYKTREGQTQKTGYIRVATDVKPNSRTGQKYDIRFCENTLF